MALLPKTASGLVGVLGTSDYYSFTLSAAEAVDLDLSLAFGTASIALYQTAGSSPIATASGSLGSDGWINQVLGAGTYYLKVTGASSASDAGYTLSANLGLPAVGTAAANAGGTSLAGALSAGALTATPVTFLGYVASFSTTEYYSFSVTGLSTVSATLSGLSNNATLVLVDGSGATVATVNGSSVANGSLRQALAPLASGTYTFEVTGGSSQPTGFNLSLSATPIQAGSGRATASAQALGPLTTAAQTVPETLTPADPTNYFSFSLASPASVALTLTGVTDIATLTLMDASGTALTSGTASYGNNVGLVRSLAALPAGGPYYVSVTDTGGSTGYSLTASATPLVNAAGGTAATARDVGALGAVTTGFSGYVGAAIPAADYRIVLPAAATLNVALEGFSGLASSGAQLTLYDPTGARVGTANSTSDSTAVLASYILQAGTYDAEVTPAAPGQDAPYTIGFSSGAVAVGTASANSAGTSLATARDIDTLAATASTYADFVGPSDTNDYYKFTLAGPSRLDIGVTGLASNLVVSVQDGSGAELLSAVGNAGLGASLIQELAAGTYYIDVIGPNATGYSLSAAAIALPVAAGGTLATAASLGTLGTAKQSVSGFVGPAETTNAFKFTVAANSRVSVGLSGIGVSGLATIAVEDSTGKAISRALASYGSTASVIPSLVAGTYYAVVTQSAATNYTLTASAAPIVDTAGTSFAAATALGVLDPASSGVTAAAAASASASGPVAVIDTMANIQAALDSLETIARAGKLTGIAATDAGTPTLTASAAQLAADADAVARIGSAYTIAATGVTAAGAAAQAAAANVGSVAVGDGAGAVQANLDALETLARAGKLASVSFTGTSPSLALTAAQFAADSDAIGTFTGNPSLFVTGVTAAGAATTAGNARVTSVSVGDSAAGVQAGLDALEGVARAGKLSAISLTGGGSALAVTGAQLTADADVFGKIAGSYSLAVTGATAAVAAAQVGVVAVASVAVADTMANIQSNLDSLETLARAGRLGAVATTDAPTPTLTTSAAQLAADSDAVAKIGGPFNELVAIRADANAPLVLNNGVNTVVGVSGNDTITTGTGGTLVFLGPGSASVVAQGADTISGNTGAATIAAASSNTLAFALFGPLDFIAGSGASTIVAGAVATTLVGGSGRTLLFSGGGTIYTGSSGTDTIVGQGGSVTIQGGSGGGLFAGGSGGNNQITAGPGNTTVFGGGAGDVLTASALNSTVTALFAGGSGAETLTGASSRSSNTFFAGSGNQSLVGGLGNNVLVAGNGQDTLAGGPGLTLFSFIRGRFGGTATVQGFDPGHDFIQIAGYASSGATAAQNAKVVAGSAVLTLSDGTQVTFAGVTAFPSYSFI